jgi:hypothetical protein
MSEPLKFCQYHKDFAPAEGGKTFVRNKVAYHGKRSQIQNFKLWMCAACIAKRERMKRKAA